MELAHLQQKAVRAHNWTSFSPEKRGEQMIKDYSAELSADMAELEAGGASAEIIADYKARYERFFSAYLGAKSNCFSAMITGPSGFNSRRHAKANRSEDRHYEIFREWRGKAKKAIIRRAQPPKTYNSELERYRADLAGMQENHAKMKEGNKKISKANKEGEDLTEYLTTVFNIAPHMIAWTMRFGFGLANNNANMKRIEARIKELEAKEAIRQDQPQSGIKFEGGEVVLNFELDRLQIIFDDRPGQDMISALKGRAFRWSPSNKAWQRNLTNNTIYDAKNILKINIDFLKK